MRMLRSFSTLSALFVLSALAAPEAARGASVDASAQSYEAGDSQTHPSVARASVTRQGPGAPGSSAATASATYGGLYGVARMTGCGFEVNGFQQVCNNSSTYANYSDVITILANAPNGTPVQVRGTVTLSGSIDGTGGYHYQGSAAMNGDGRGFSGSTGGVVTTVSNLSIDGAHVWTANFVVGGNYALTGHLETHVINRYCATGTSSCTASASTWQMTVSAGLTFRLEVLTSGLDVQILSAGGHDYLAPTVSVAAPGRPATSLSAAWPNPSSGWVSLDLALAEPSAADVGVFDIAGRRVATLAQGPLPAGVRTLQWDGRDLDGRETAGLFFVRARGEGFALTRRVLRVR